MSGIYGMVRHDGAPVTAETLAPMAAAMSFWGPDGHGQWCGDGAGLGHFMLHVTPESLDERLPASIRVAPHLIITADARIDNRGELFDALGVPAAGRARTPDSSLILLAYERWDADCVRRLLGDFAFAIWDSRERKLFCARDPFGCMPFVYHYDGKRFIFASDIKGVLARMESPKLYEAMIAAYLQMKTYHAEKRLTFFEDVVKIPPAHTLTVTPAGAQLSRYWRPEDAPEIRLATDTDYAEQMRVLFEDSVNRRLRSAFPVGSHLSGGLDSSAVSVAAARLLAARGRKLEVFSWSPPPESGSQVKPDNEHGRVRAVCDAERLTCHFHPPITQNYLDIFQKDFTLEPFDTVAREQNVQISASALGLRVILSGWGGDEAVSSHTGSALAEFFSGGQWSEFRAAAGFRMSLVPDGSLLATGLRRTRKLGGIARDVIAPHFPDSLFSMLIHNVWQTHENNCALPEFARLHRNTIRLLRGPAYRPQPGIRSSIRYLMEFGHLSKRMEYWAESGASRCLVYRYPMLDRRLVEFTLGVPAPQLCRQYDRPGLFRRAVFQLLPASCDWDQRKSETIAFADLRRTLFNAHEQWARRLAEEAESSGPTRFVDPRSVWRAVQGRKGEQRIRALSGFREAFSCCVAAKSSRFR